MMPGSNISAPYKKLSEYTDKDSENNAMLKSHAYKAQNDGVVCARVTGQNTKILKGFVGLTNDPAGAGLLIQETANAEGSLRLNMSFEVAKNEYFEITYDGTNVPTIFWKSDGGCLLKPIDYN